MTNRYFSGNEKTTNEKTVDNRIFVIRTRSLDKEKKKRFFNLKSQSISVDGSPFPISNIEQHNGLIAVTNIGKKVTAIIFLFISELDTRSRTPVAIKCHGRFFDGPLVCGFFLHFFYNFSGVSSAPE